MDETRLKPVGYGALLERYHLNPLPHWCVSHVTPRGDRRTVVAPDLTSEVYPARYDPGDTAGDHLEFALKYEGVNLEILRAVFMAAEVGEVTAYVRSKPSGKYLDMTRIAERLFEFVEATIDDELTGELDYLASYDRIKRGLQDVVDMPDRRLDLFIRLCLQNKGRLAKGKRGQFDGLTDEEIQSMEKVVLAEMRQSAS